MVLNVFIVNKEESEKGNEVGKWIKLPISLKELKKEMISIGSILEEDLIIKEYKSNVKVKLNIDSETDIGYLNSQIIELNKYATNNQIRALSEVYSSDIEELIEEARKGHYEFFPNMTMSEVAEKIRHRKQYNCYPYLSEKNGLELIEEDLWKRGYKEIKSGVIYVW
jgi:hypothetical protein